MISFCPVINDSNDTIKHALLTKLRHTGRFEFNFPQFFPNFFFVSVKEEASLKVFFFS